MEEIDFLVVDLIMWMNDNGIETFTSCSGHPHEVRYSFPHIGFVLNDNENTSKLVEFLQAYAIEFNIWKDVDVWCVCNIVKSFLTNDKYGASYSFSNLLRKQGKVEGKSLYFTTLLVMLHFRKMFTMFISEVEGKAFEASLRFYSHDLAKMAKESSVLKDLADWDKMDMEYDYDKRDLVLKFKSDISKLPSSRGYSIPAFKIGKQAHEATGVLIINHEDNTIRFKDNSVDPNETVLKLLIALLCKVESVRFLGGK